MRRGRPRASKGGYARPRMAEPDTQRLLTVLAEVEAAPQPTVLAESGAGVADLRTICSQLGLLPDETATRTEGGSIPEGVPPDCRPKMHGRQGTVEAWTLRLLPYLGTTSDPGQVAAVLSLLAAVASHPAAKAVYAHHNVPSQVAWHLLRGRALRPVAPGLDCEYGSFVRSLRKFLHCPPALAATEDTSTGADAHPQLQLAWNFGLWAYTPFALQRAVLAMLAEDVAAQPGLYRRVVGLQRVLDLARLCYWETEAASREVGAIPSQRPPLPVALAAIATSAPPRSADVEGQDRGLTPPELKELRGQLLGLGKAMLPSDTTASGDEGITQDEVAALFDTAENSLDMALVQEVLQMLLELLGDARVCEHVRALGGLPFLLSCCTPRCRLTSDEAADGENPSNAPPGCRHCDRNHATTG